MRTRNETDAAIAKPVPEEWLETVRRQVGSLRFGVVQVVVHDSRVVQIEKTERIRFDLLRESK